MANLIVESPSSKVCPETNTLSTSSVACHPEAEGSEACPQLESAVSVKCGSVCGILYLDKLKSKGHKGSLKCIYSGGTWYTPVEFECLGGKAKSKNWRKSILHDNVQLGIFLTSVDFPGTRSGSQSPRQLSPLRTCATDKSTLLIDPVLAFIKAFRLKGDNVKLKQAVISRFDSLSLSTAHRLLWDTCGSDLELLGLSFHQRRASEKRQLSDIILADILVALDKLDDNDKIPAVYCEALDLIRLPSLVLDPVSRQVETNTTTLASLVHVVHELPSKVSNAVSEPVKKCYSDVDLMISNVKLQLDQFVSSIKTLTSSQISTRASPLLGSASKAGSSSVSSSIKSSVTSGTKHSPQFDRSRNVILFGLPESSLLQTKSAIDSMSTHLIGKSVKVLDAFRLGRKSPEASVSTARPRPLLIKLDSSWDRRLLLASCRKLKGYTTQKLFLREDLPPEARITKHKADNKIIKNKHIPGTAQGLSNNATSDDPVLPPTNSTIDSHLNATVVVEDPVCNL